MREREWDHPLRPGQATVPLSRCGQWVTDLSGHVTKVRCPDRDCLNLAPLENSCIGAHPRDIGGRCPWTGVRVVDDRADKSEVRAF
ncbi:hypothetical protein [Nocardia callitridis]|uniref:Uncharacterized protein n=1 Tax=Nocardia callitridis TaxID=648753 RepID=A0ABP9JZC9_9NOCA